MKKSIYISTVLIFSLACSKEDLNIEETNQMEYTISDPFIEQYSQFGDVWLAEQDYEAFFQEIFASGYVNLYVVDQFEGDRLEIYVYPDYEGTPPQFRMGSSGYDRDWDVGDNYVQCPKGETQTCTIGYGDGSPILIKKVE